jgi:hypothetical protein
MDGAMYEKYLHKFVEEAQMLGRLDHPNIVKVTDIFQENNTAYIVMPFVNGQTLQQTVEEKGRLDYGTAVNYIAQIAEAVTYIHEKDILHRDIKPENIIITPENRAVLIDFGSAREFIHDKTQNHTSILTAGYAPLEQYSSIGKKGSYSDIYSLGAVFYFALTGHKPMDAATRTMETMPEPQSLRPSIPREANRTIMKAMQLKPENRQQRVGEFMGDLLNKRIEKQQVKKPRVKFLTVLCILIGILGIGIFYSDSIFTGMQKSGYNVSERVACVNLNGKWGYIDKTGNEIIPCIYYFAWNFSEGLATVELNGKGGYIDKTGREIIPCIYDWAWKFSEGLATVKLNGKRGYIDKTGNEIIPCKYDFAWYFSEGLVPVELNGNRGYIDKTGNEIIPCKYDGAENFSEGLAKVKLNGKWGYIDKTGYEIIPCKYDEYVAWGFSEGLAAVKLNGKWGYIDKTGNEIIPCIYDWARSFSEGLAVVELNGKCGYIDKTGNVIIPCKYDTAGEFHDVMQTE